MSVIKIGNDVTVVVVVVVDDDDADVSDDDTDDEWTFGIVSARYKEQNIIKEGRTALYCYLVITVLIGCIPML